MKRNKKRLSERRVEAITRQTTYVGLTTAQKIAKLGKFVARRQRERLGHQD